jgi:hypothetical protein
MKQIKALLVMMLMVLGLNTSPATNLDGRYISKSGELMFTFVGDSLYVDTWPSGCGISCYKLRTLSNHGRIVTFSAYDTYFDGETETYRQVLIRVEKLGKDRYLIEYSCKDKDRDWSTHELYHIYKE